MVVQRVWSGRGSSNAIQDANNWSPVGIPQAGDLAIIETGNVLAEGLLPSGALIELGIQAANARVSSLTLKNAIVPSGTTIVESTAGNAYSSSLPSSLQFAGAVDNQGNLIFIGGVQPVVLPSGTTLTNNGTMNVFGSSPQFGAAAADVAFVNNRLIRIVNPGNQNGQLATLGTAIGGTGTISVSLDAGLEFGGAVGGGQTLRFVGETNAASSVQIDQPSGFSATIGGFVTGDTLTLKNTVATSMTYVASGVASGTLQVRDGTGMPVASLQFAGVYTVANFRSSQSGSSLTITTDVTDSATGSTAFPRSSPVYRFFDTTDGTQFYTPSVAERDSVLVSRPDLVQEVNTFGAVTTASSATLPVYRFFDTVHGNHFFTGSATERDQLIATRSDLVYEPAATSLADATLQPGDVAVYRLFSKINGTHLYTGSAAESSALTTPGATGYRADLVPEGVSFFAPSGNYL